MVSLRVIAGLEWSLSAISLCAECKLSAARSYERSLRMRLQRDLPPP